MISDCGVAAAKGNHVYALLTGEAVDSAEFAQSCDSDEAAVTALINAAMYLDQKVLPAVDQTGNFRPWISPVWQSERKAERRALVRQDGATITLKESPSEADGLDLLSNWDSELIVVSGDSTEDMLSR